MKTRRASLERGVEAGELHECSVRERWPYDERLADVLQGTVGRVWDRLFHQFLVNSKQAVKTPEQVSRARELLRLRTLWQVTVVSW